MYEGLLRELGGVMAEDTYSCFMAAFKRKIDDKIFQQNDLAQKTGVSSQHLNAIYKERVGKNKKPIRAGYELQQKIAEAFGFQIIDFLKFGEKIVKNTQPDELKNTTPTPSPPTLLGQAANHINPIDYLAITTTLVGQYQKNDDRMRFWREIFEMLPVYALIIKDSIVIYQNTKSRVIGNITGAPLCDNCAGKDCKNPEDCPIHVSIVTGAVGSGYQFIKGQRFKVDIAPLRWHEHEYYIVLATEADNDDTSDRRGGGDRREEPREE